MRVRSARLAERTRTWTLYITDQQQDEGLQNVWYLPKSTDSVTKVGGVGKKLRFTRCFVARHLMAECKQIAERL